MAKNYPGQHTQLKRGDGAGSEVFTLIPHITSIDGPGLDTNLVDSTTLDDDAETFVYGVNKAGTVSFELNFDPQNAQHKGLMDDWKNHVTRNFQYILPDDGLTMYSFAALVKSFKAKASAKAVLTQSVELQISGAPTLVTT